MILPPVQQFGTLIRRYKRFLADISLTTGETLTVHCPNSGSMRGCSDPGSPVMISKADNPKRKYGWTLEMVQHDNIWIGVNTARTNNVVHEALENGTINDFGHILSIRPEIQVSDRSRLDFQLETETCTAYLEVKNCSLAENGTAMFPDAVTARGTKHLHELDRLRRAGNECAVLFCIQRADADRFMAAVAIDPVYAQALRQVEKNGVKVLAYQAGVTPEAITLTTKLPVYTDE
ncbi:MAG TPA: DNA/RNA nuclease SfsA [Desulfobulbaceae bacterium]|nr:DNA/RNA nuclease SfsA [Desulfobulbaceae bacterium]